MNRSALYVLTALLLWTHSYGDKQPRRRQRQQRQQQQDQEQQQQQQRQQLQDHHQQQEQQQQHEDQVQFTTLPTIIYGPTYSYDTVPETAFTCRGKSLGGYYADVETDCQLYHVCNVGRNNQLQDIKFLCGNGTVFDQRKLVCQDSRKVRCAGSERFYRKGIPLEVELRNAREDENHRRAAAKVDLLRYSRQPE